MSRITTIWRCLGHSGYYGSVSPKQDHTRSPTCKSDQGMHGALLSFIRADFYLGSHEDKEVEEVEEKVLFRLRKWGSRHQGMYGTSFSFICTDSYLGSLEEEEEEKSSFRLRKWLRLRKWEYRHHGMHGRSSSFICADSYLGSLEEEEETGSFGLRKWLRKRESRRQGMHGRLLFLFALTFT